MKPTLLILAAGIGSRYGGLKQVDSIGLAGEAIIEYSVYDAIRAGFGKVVFVIRESIEVEFKEKFAGKFDDQIAVDYVFQEVDTPIEGIEKFPDRNKPWGTAHAVLVAEKAIQEPFLVINADDYYGVDAFQQMSAFLQNQVSPHHYGMVGYLIKNTLSENGSVSRGVCESDNHGFLTSVTERTKILREAESIFYEEDGEQVALDENTIVSMNFWGFHTNIFGFIREQFIEFVDRNYENPKAEFYIPLVVNNLIHSDKVRLSVMTSHDQWYGVTYQEDKKTVQNAFWALTANGLYPNGLWKKTDSLNV